MANGLLASSTPLQDWLNYLATSHAKMIDLGLERIQLVAKRLGVLHFHCPVITVAGTNGKGSCVALTAAILTAAGYRVATYTSPHLMHYNERIQIAGRCVSDQDLCHAFTQIEKIRAEISLTYFEFGTLAAFLLFKQASLDAIILEVGLGGRLDAVNCVDADLAIISMIDLDHMDYLGSTREAIGKEKAGIMRRYRSCVCGDFSIPLSISQQAQLLNSPFYRQGIEFDYQMHGVAWSWQSQQQSLTDLPLPSIDLQNAASVLQAIELLGTQFSISRAAIEQGLKQVFLQGRFQIIEKDSRQIIIDVAHNPAGGRCLSKRLSTHRCSGKTHAIVAMLADKDSINTLRPLQHQVDRWYVSSLDVPRGASAAQLKLSLRSFQVTSAILEFSAPALAFQQAYQALQQDDRLLVFGSFHTAAAIFKLLQHEC